MYVYIRDSWKLYIFAFVASIVSKYRLLSQQIYLTLLSKFYLNQLSRSNTLKI